MNIFSIILYLFTGLSFVLVLIGFMSPSQIKRQKFIIVFVLLMLMSWAIFRIFGSRSDFPRLLIIHFLAAVMFWPQIIARLIIQKRVNFYVAKSKRRFSDVAIGIMGIVLMSGMSLLFMLPNKIGSINHYPIYDWEYVSSRVSFLFLTISVIVWSFMLAIQKTTFHKDGLIYNGLSWAWSDFQAYAWATFLKDSSTVELQLNTCGIWPIKQVKLKVKIDDKQKIEQLLGTSIRQS